MTSSTPSPSIEDQTEQVADPEFVNCLEQEADLVKASIEEGITPMKAHARAMMWLDTLVKIHAVGLDQSLTDENANQAAVWSRDLASLELALALVQNVPPLKQPEGM
jgi:hypothetical protein